MPTSLAFVPGLVVQDRPPRREHLWALEVARGRAAPHLGRLLEAMKVGTPADLERIVPVTLRELDLLWQALGRITQP